MCGLAASVERGRWRSPLWSDSLWSGVVLVELCPCGSQSDLSVQSVVLSFSRTSFCVKVALPSLIVDGEEAVVVEA